MTHKTIFLALLISSIPYAIYGMEPAQQEKCPICWEDKPTTECVHPTCCNAKQILCIDCYQEILKKNYICPFCRSDNCSLEKQKHILPQKPFQRPPSRSISEKILDACLLQ